MIWFLHSGTSYIRSFIFDLCSLRSMLDMGFEPQIRDIVERTGMPSGISGRRTMMFSATFPSSIQRLAKDFLCAPVDVTIGKVGAATNTVLQRTIQVNSDEEKMEALVDALKAVPGEQSILWCTARHYDDSICSSSL